MADKEAPGNSGGVQLEEQHRRTLDVTEDLQNIRLVIDIGDDRTVEIPLKGKLILQNSGRPEAKDNEKAEKFLNKMRGWLMTVGALFIMMAFQAALQPPAWLRTTDFLRLSQSEIDRWNHRYHGFSHAAAAAAAAPARFAPSPSPSRQAVESATADLSWRAKKYMSCNYATLGSSLALVLLLLLLPNKPPNNAFAKLFMGLAITLLLEISLSVVWTVALGTSEDWRYTLSAFSVIGFPVGLTLLCHIVIVLCQIVILRKEILLWIVSALPQALTAQILKCCKPVSTSMSSGSGVSKA